ncbi:MAG: hypothetical protein M3O71_21355 [Bacteroidota bacterium]|nr:hypothetical protein [Bacteroidota bacterium]
MSEIKSLADQLRSNISKQEAPKLAGKLPEIPEILKRIRAYDNRDHKGLMHVRFDSDTIRLLNQFKMATGVDVTKLVAFSVHELFELQPELKSIIKQFIQQLEL